MARKEKNIHYIYKTTCNITGNWYIGMHSTGNKNDSYLGSGKRLRYSVRKYGSENHTKEIISYHNTRELLIEAEILFITDDMVLDKNCMNLKLGGCGGFISEEHKIKFLEGRKWGMVVGNKKAVSLRKDTKLKKQHVDKIVASRIKYFETNDGTFKNKTHSKETKQKMSESSKWVIGENNSQYGTCWIMKDGLNKKIKKDYLDTYLEEGWVKGRKIK